jgi:hypothetical protein
MASTISCLAATLEQAERIVHDLEVHGIDRGRISVLLPDPRVKRNLNFERTVPMDHGPVVGVGTGAGLGSLLGWVAGLAVLAIPGVGPFLAAGPILAAMGAAAAGATAGAIAGGLIGLGMPEAQAAHYDARLREGHLLIWAEVTSSDEAERVAELFAFHHAEDIVRAGPLACAIPVPTSGP